MTLLNQNGVLDATIRDAGYLNNWDFSKETIFTIVSTLSDAGVDGIEVGYLSEDYSRPIAACCPPDFLATLKHMAKPSNVVAMLSLSEPEPEKILLSRKGLLDLVRIPSTFDEIPVALELATKINQSGIPCSFNLVNISALTPSKILEATKSVVKSNVVDILYLADSRGACTPEEITEMVNTVRQEWRGTLGFHGHDNIGFGSLNSSAALKAGCDLIDGTISGFGLGGGNTNLAHALTLMEENTGTSRYQFDALETLQHSIVIPMPPEHSYLYYLSGQKNLAQLWIPLLLEKYGRKTVAHLERIPKKPYKFIEEVLQLA